MLEDFILTCAWTALIYYVAKTWIKEKYLNGPYSDIHFCHLVLFFFLCGGVETDEARLYLFVVWFFSYAYFYNRREKILQLNREIEEVNRLYSEERNDSKKGELLNRYHRLKQKLDFLENPYSW